jgi:hypothetical protein
MRNSYVLRSFGLTTGTVRCGEHWLSSWSTITRNGITKAKATSYYFLRPTRSKQHSDRRFGAGGDSAASSAITAAPHEYFDHSATSEGWHVQWETVPPG